MKKLVLGAVAALCCGTSLKAEDVFNTGFENVSSFEEIGWKAIRNDQATGTYLPDWTIDNYENTTDKQFPANLGVNYLGGSQVARLITGYWTYVGKADLNSWLISPKVKVDNAKKFLSFMIAYNHSYNGYESLTEEQRNRFEVRISTTDSDTTSFMADENRLLEMVPMGLCKFGTYSIDLSKYVGQEVYIGFRMYGSPKTTPARKDFFFLDNVALAEAKPDYAVVETPTFVNGTVESQLATLKVVNYGAKSDACTIKYQVGDGAVVEEKLQQALEPNVVTDVALSNPVQFQPGDNVVKFWTEVAGDAYAYNDSCASTMKLFEVGTLPLMMTESNKEDLLASSYSTMKSSVMRGWSYDGVTTNIWLYTFYNTASVKASKLYSVKSLPLKKGKLAINMDYTCTSTDASVQAFLTHDYSDFGEALGSASLKNTVEATSGKLLIDVPEDGNYILGLGVTTAETNAQVALFGLNVEVPSMDVAMSAVASPAASAAITASGVPVTIKVANEGPADMSDVKLYYQWNNESPVAETLDVLPVGAKLDYTFSEPLKPAAAGMGALKVWCQNAADTNAANDTLVKYVYVYEPLQIPYTSGFETASDSLLWTTVNVDSDDSYWGIEESSLVMEGSKVMYINNILNEAHNDLAISPAIQVAAATRARVAFYYGTPTLKGCSSLKVYLTQSLDAAKVVSEGVLLKTLPITTTGWQYAYAPVTFPEAGVYYIALVDNEGQCEILVDDFRVDQASEVAMKAVASSVEGMAYDIASTQVTATIENCGMEALSGILLSYTLQCLNDKNEVVGQSTITETYEAALAAGDTLTYTFQTPAELQWAGHYQISATVSHEQDADAKNNTMLCEGPTKIGFKEVPVILNFEDESDRAAVVIEGKWRLATTTPYEGKYSLSHSGAATVEGGDWAYLNRMKLAKGIYDLSFFWKTMTNNVTDNARQSATVYLATAENSEAVIKTLVTLTDTLNADHKCVKELLPLEIEEDGYYLIAIKCTTTNTVGNMVFDDFEVNAPAQGLALAAGASYTADFAGKEDEWYHYFPTRTSAQWTAAEVDGQTVMTTYRKYTDYSNQWTTPGLYEAPAFMLKADENYTVNFDYSIEAYSGSELDGLSTLDLYLADKDQPAAFTTLLLSGKEGETAASTSFTVPEDGVYYLGFNPASAVSATFNLKSFTLKNTSTITGLNQVNRQGLTMQYAECKLLLNGLCKSGVIYDMTGAQVMSFGPVNAVALETLAPGLYIVKVAGEQSTKIAKILVK